MTETQAVAVALGVLWAFTLLLWWLHGRRLRRQVHDAAARLEAQPLAEVRGLERTIGLLERAVDHAVVRGGDADAASIRMGHALSAIPAGVVLLDEGGEIVYRNQPAATFLTARHGEALVEQAIRELSSDALDGLGGTRTVEIFGPPRRTLVLTSSPLDDGRRSIGGLVLIEDVTERRRLDAVRRDFVANISHELKTPVGGLGVLAETMADEEDPAIMRRLALRMHHDAMRASRTIDDLLELSRIEAGESALRDPVPVHLVLAEAVERATSGAEQRGVTIVLEEPSRHLAVLGDRRQLVSAIFNLVDNAVKYSDPGSSVRLRAGTDGSVIDIVVQDHGVGIPRRDLERVFERFYRVDRGRSRDTGGTGLGLAIVRHVAANHRGDVFVDSREGEGSTFTLRLPAGAGPVVVTARAG